MPKYQTVTSRNKKASDARTSKASHLKLIPTANRNTAMNNSTAESLNFQAVQAYDAADEALSAVTQSMEFLSGLEFLFDSICQQVKDRAELNHIMHAARMGGYVCNNSFNSLDENKTKLESHLNTLRGASHE